MNKNDLAALVIIILLMVVAVLLFIDVQVKNTYIEKYEDIQAKLLNYTETESMKVFCEVAAVYCYNVPGGT